MKSGEARSIDTVENKLHIIFHNEEDSHDLSVDILIGCLMHTSRLIQSANRQINESKQIEVRIKALAPGSFAVHLEVVESALRSLFSSASISYVASLVTVVGGLYKLAQWVRKSKRIKSIARKKEEHIVILEDEEGQRLEIDSTGYDVYNTSDQVREEVAQQFKVLSEAPDITAVEIEAKEVVRIPAEEFRRLSEAPTPETDDDKPPRISVKENCQLLIVHPSFAQNLRWDFIYEGRKISALMADSDLYQLIEDGKDFAKGDRMLVDLEVIEEFDQEYQTYMLTKNSYRILKYKTLVKAPRGNQLFDDA